MQVSAPEPSPSTLTVRYFDGRSSRAQRVQARLIEGELWLEGEGWRRCLPEHEVRWPERTRHGPRVAHLTDGASLQSTDTVAWDRWRQNAGARDGLVVRLQQSWRAVWISMTLVVSLMVAGYFWGLPWLARAMVHALPESVETRVGEAVLEQLDGMLEPSQLSPQQQQAIEQAWDEVRRKHEAAQATRGVIVRPTRLLIRHSDIGPNALALPGGTLVLTDDLARLLHHDTRVIAGVLAHELGHVQHRHGMRMLVQVGILGVVSSVLWGDFSGLMAAVPLWLGQAHYSREAEREADAYSVQVLSQAGLSPALMVGLFERFDAFRRCGRSVLAPAPGAPTPQESESTACEAHTDEAHGAQGGLWGLGFASHPADAERMAFFRQAAL